MRSRDEDEASGVEFLVVTDVGWDADSDEPSARRRPPVTSAVRRILAVAVVIVLGGALVLRTATSHDTFHAAAKHTTQAPTPEPSETSVSAWQAGTGTGGVMRRFTIPDQAINCPSGGCTVGMELPAAFAAAVQAHLGGTASDNQIDVTYGTKPHVWYRQLTATGPDKTRITVTVTKNSGGRTITSGTKQTPTSVVGSVSCPTGRSGFMVEVEVTGPLGWTPPLDAMQALALDPRLLVLG